MAFERFKALWKHRYIKYSHIFTSKYKGAQLANELATIKKKSGVKLIAIVRTEHFGDIIAAEPLSRSIRNDNPDAFIVWFVKPAFKELVEVNPHIDLVVPEYCLSQRIAVLDSGIFDAVYELQFINNNHCVLCQTSKENQIAVSKNITVHNYFERGNLLEVFAAIANLPVPKDQQPRLYLQDRHRERIDRLELPKKYIAIHCQSNYAPKDWPSEKWDQLIDWLLEKFQYHIVEIGLSSKLSVSNSRYINMTGGMTLLESAEVINRADYFIGLDSGPSHFANATQTFGFIMMGALNNFKFYNPYSGKYGDGENCVIIRAEDKPCCELELEKVQEALLKVLPSKIESLKA